MDLSSFPPFYTLQPNYQLQQQYLNTWIEKIIQQALRTKNFQFDRENQIFLNKNINRKAESELIDRIINQMIEMDLLEEKQSKKYHIKVQSSTKVAQHLQRAFQENHMDNDVYTIEEILDVASQVPQLSICNKDEILSALKILEQQKQVALIGDQDNLGIKIDMIK